MSGVRPAEEADFVHVDPLLRQVFDIPTGPWERFRSRVPVEDFRVLTEAGVLRAALALYRFGQHVGGRVVSSAGVAVVGVPPEARGAGWGSRLVAGTLAGLRAEGVALSVLYPATRKPYRRVGYECAGTRVDWAIPTAAIGLADRALPAHRVASSAPERLHAMYRAWAREAGTGLLDRSAAIWDRVVRPWEHESFVYVFGEDEGYLVFHQEDGASVSHACDLRVKDFVALTPAALRRGWTLLADHQSIAATVRWTGGAQDPRLLALPEVGGTAGWVEQWMARVVHLEAALVGRGYRVDGVLDLDLVDAVLPENAGRWRLTVAGGVGALARGGTGALATDARGLAALYTGFTAAETAARLGLVRGDAATLATATALFAGPESWLCDRF